MGIQAVNYIFHNSIILTEVNLRIWYYQHPDELLHPSQCICHVALTWSPLLNLDLILLVEMNIEATFCYMHFRHECYYYICVKVTKRND